MHDGRVDENEGAAGREPGRAAREGPLSGIIVLDLSRMLPGAVLARALLQLGARVIRVEAPGTGDPLRALPPLAEPGSGAAFAAFLAGAESVALDLRHAPAATAVRALAARADVLVESFRPGTLARWGLDPAQLAAENPRLVVCSLTSFGSDPRWRDEIGHDLNFAAISGLASLLSGDDGRPRVPGVPIVDITGGILAACSILAALLERQRTGRGRILEQPLALAPLPFMTWPWAEAQGMALDVGGSYALLVGTVPAYRLYRCAHDEWLALGAMEPKLWLAFLDVLGLPELAPAGLDAGEAGRVAGERVQARLAEHPRTYWLARARERRLPLSAVHDPAAAQDEPFYNSQGGAAASWLGAAALPGALPRSRAPRLGEHTEAVLREAGLTPAEIDAACGR